MIDICFLLPQIAFGPRGGFVGGYVNNVINLCSKLQYDQCRLTLLAGIVAPSAEQLTALHTTLPRVDIHTITMKSPPTTPAYVGEFAVRAIVKARTFGRFRDGLVYGHSGFPGYGVVTRFCAQVLGARAAHVLYCPVEERWQHRQVGWVTKSLNRYALKNIELVAISENVANSVKRFLGKTPSIYIIAPAIRDELLFGPREDGATNERNKQYQAESPAAVVGFIGHHRREKGLDLAIAAVSRLIREGMGLRLEGVLSGGESREEGTMVARRMADTGGVREYCEFVSGVEAIESFLQRVDVLIVPFRGTRGPSDYPMVLLEAMAVGTLVVATPVGAVPEVIDDGMNGFLAAEVTVDAIAASLRKSVQISPLRRASIVQRAARDVSRFSSERIARQTRQFAERVLKHDV